MHRVKTLLSSRTAQFTILTFLIFTIWWLFLSPLNPESPYPESRTIWSVTYQLIALWGGINGLFISTKWGGVKSVIGRSIVAFSIGLLLQSFGQTVYSYYLLRLHIDAPYPSLGDVGYFGTIPFYIYGVLLLAKASGIRISIKSFGKKLQAVLIPLVILFISYYVFLRGYEFDWSAPIRVFLDFGYPLGGAIYISLTLLTLLLSRKVLGGIMKTPILFILAALVFEYAGDFTFPYSVSQETYFAGSYVDYLYVVAYSMMALSLIRLGVALKEVTES